MERQFLYAEEVEIGIPLWKTPWTSATFEQKHILSDEVYPQKCYGKTVQYLYFYLWDWKWNEDPWNHLCDQYCLFNCIGSKEEIPQALSIDSMIVFVENYKTLQILIINNSSYSSLPSLLNTSLLNKTKFIFFIPATSR